MEQFIVDTINSRLSKGEIQLTEFLVDYMYVEGYVEEQDYINYINTQAQFTFKMTNKCGINDKVHRYEMVENKSNLKKITLDMFN